MKKTLLLTGGLLLVIISETFATRLEEVKIVDREILLVMFKDGEVFYRDDGSGPGGYAGHDYAPGNDTLVAYDRELDVDLAASPNTWTLVSDEDTRYGKNGAHPLAVYRKSKVNNTDHQWNYKLDHWMFWEHRLPGNPTNPDAFGGHSECALRGPEMGGCDGPTRKPISTAATRGPTGNSLPGRPCVARWRCTGISTGSPVPDRLTPIRSTSRHPGKWSGYGDRSFYRGSPIPPSSRDNPSVP